MSTVLGGGLGRTMSAWLKNIQLLKFWLLQSLQEDAEVGMWFADINALQEEKAVCTHTLMTHKYKRLWRGLKIHGSSLEFFEATPRPVPNANADYAQGQCRCSTNYLQKTKSLM